MKLNFYKMYQLMESFFKNFDLIDKVITKDRSKEIYRYLLEMFPGAKKIIDYQFQDEAGKPFAEWRRMIFEIDNYTLHGPVVLDSKKINMDAETRLDRQEKYNQYIRDKDQGKQTKYFRDNLSDPRFLDFSKLPPVTVLEENGKYEIVDGAHRVFLAQNANKPLSAYIWKKQKNNHPNVIKIKNLFNGL